MPTQRTLILIIAGLMVIVSFLAGYILGTNPKQVTVVQSAEKKISNKDIALKKIETRAAPASVSSYGKVYTGDKGQIFHPSVVQRKQSEIGIAEQPKFIFKPVQKAKKAYSWRQDRQNIEIQSEQGDGTIRYREVDVPRARQPIAPRPANPNYAPSYGAGGYYAPNPYPMVDPGYSSNYKPY